MTAQIYNFTEEKRKREIGKALDDRVSISVSDPEMPLSPMAISYIKKMAIRLDNTYTEETD